MSLQDKKEKLDAPEKSLVNERVPKVEGEINIEKKETVKDREITSAELRREIEMMEIDGSQKEEAQKKAKKISFLGEQDKIEHLLQLAREKGVVFAVSVARQMNEPFLLDVLHDALANEGFYKDFSK